MTTHNEPTPSEAPRILSWHVRRQFDIIVEPRLDASGECRTVKEVQARLRSFIASSGWTRLSRSEASRRVSWMIRADIEKPFVLEGWN